MAQQPQIMSKVGINLKTLELLSLSPITLKQFELAMATQAHQPLIDNNSSQKCD
jgi:hypothetical protein